MTLNAEAILHEPHAQQADHVARPSIIVVDRHEDLAEIANELQDRYGSSYEVHATSSASAAHDLLLDLAAGGGEVALVLAAHDLSDKACMNLSVRTRELHPIARRGLLVGQGRDRSTPEALTEATAYGHMDHFVVRPRRRSDERFHRSITTFLDDWWRLRGEEVAVIQLVGDPTAPRIHELCDLLSRNDVPHTFHSNDVREGIALLSAAGLTGEQRPVAILNDGRVLIDPTNRETGAALGARIDPSSGTYDVAIIGGGPAGLAAAVYAASEGLSTAVIEHEALGGQAGTSSLIRNYLGFPRGITGKELAARALEQATVLGAEVIYGSEVTSLRTEGDAKVIGRADGSQIQARAVVIATGVSYQRLPVPGLEALIGKGVFYGAAVSEAKSLAGKKVFVVGGGNSAGQSALHLSKYAKSMTIVVRSDSLAASMSNYLITELESRPNIHIRFCTEVDHAIGDDHLEQIAFRNRGTHEMTTEDADALVILIGGEPRTSWLPVDLPRDQWGYVLTGSAAERGDSSQSQSRGHLETTMPGVFAVGDVRQGSVKRVASAAGEGAVCVQQVHQYLAHHDDGVAVRTA